MSTFAQTSDGDLLIENGRLVLVRGAAEVAVIKLRNKFRFVEGEYFLDRRQGVPYRRSIFGKGRNLNIVKQLLWSVILSVEEIDKVLDLSVSHDRRARKLSFSFRAKASDGRIVSGGSGQPFIVEGGA